MTATPTRTATFLLRQSRQVQGFREVLAAGRSEDPYVKKGYVEEGYVDDQSAGDPRSGSQDPDLTMLWIPPGRFWMGSPEKELDRQDREGPQHLVQLQGFFMGQTPITQAQWRAVAEWMEQPGETWNRDLKANPAWFDGEKRKMRKASDSASDESVVLDGVPNTDLYPVEQVSWHDAREFCNRLSQRTGRHYTLPSEAQWEYACRAGSSTPFHFGATITPGLANYNGSYTYADGPTGPYRKQTTPVGMFPANAWGLHDMHGNVWEWCQDHWHDSYEGAPSNGSAWENTPELKKTATKKKANDSVSNEESRLLRGGSWNFGPGSCRSAFRDLLRPDNADFSVGFRVVCLPQGPSLNP